MTLKDIAAKIPSHYRKDLLLNNEIYKAIADRSDSNMQMLWVLYSNYIEPNNAQYVYENKGGEIIIAGSCNICLNTVLTKFKELEPFLIELEKEKNLYDNI